MSSINTNYGMESLNVAMMKRERDNQGQIALSILQGAAQTAQTTQAAATQSVTPVANVVEGAKGANINTYA
ncbi:MAG: hypothetical protein ACI4NE_06900 [Succinivibrio sp.]